MKKLAFLFNKLNNTLTYAIFMCVAGISFIAMPLYVLDVTILILGACVSLVAVCLIVGWALDKSGKDPLARHADIVKSSLMLVYGISLMLVRSSVSRGVCVALGVLLTLYSVLRLMRPIRNLTVERTTAWYVEGAVLFILMILGIVIAILPFRSKITAGVAMIAFGGKLLSDFIAAHRRKKQNAPPRVKKSAKKPRDIYDADFVDKSEK